MMMINNWSTTQKMIKRKTTIKMTNQVRPWIEKASEPN